MIPQKVIYAIVVLNELDNVPRNRQRRKTLPKRVLADRCNLDVIILRRVLQLLYNHQYINFINTSVSLTCYPPGITVYRLFEIFYGGIPLGEERVFNYGYDSLFDAGYSKIARMEEEVRRLFRTYFETITVASLKEEIKPLMNTTDN